MTRSISGFKGRYHILLVDGTRLTCPLCQGQLFGHRLIKLNTTGATFFDMDWANLNSEGVVCHRCGRIDEFAHGFIRREAPTESPAE